MNLFLNFDLIILFFALGVVTSWVRSDLEIPESISKFLSIFLLLSLGLKGGHEVANADNLIGIMPPLLVGTASCLIIPVVIFFALRSKLGSPDAAALAASYGSVSAITFITAQSILQNQGISSSGYMVAIMALMEIPAILIGVFLYRRFSNKLESDFLIFKSILCTKSVVLLVGGFVIGFLMNEASWNGISQSIQNSFKGAVAFFLLDLGIVAQKQLGKAWQHKSIIAPLAIMFPLLCGTIALVIGHVFSITHGNLVLVATLAGSASYIAAPAAAKHSIPSANPSMYLALPLAVTFPMNILFGIPYYIWLSEIIKLH